MAGEELLVVDASDPDRERLRRLLDGLGYVVTAARNAVETQKYALTKFFPVALIDADVERMGGGLDLVRMVMERSRQTAVVLLTGRRSFDLAVEGHRLGVVDIVDKSPAGAARLTHTVEHAIARYHASDGTGDVARETRAVLDDALRIMLEQARRVYGDLSMAAPPARPRVLFVDGEGETLNAIAPLVQKQSWEILAETSGGAALDKASRERIDVLAVCEDLPDLRGTMVVRSIQADRGEVLALLYTAPGPEGRIERVERGRVMHTERPFDRLDQLVRAVERAVAELATRAQERRILQAFRNDHRDFFRRYAMLVKRLGD